MTLVFPDSLSHIYPRTAPPAHNILRSDNGSVQVIPTTGNSLLPTSQDTTVAFSVPDDEASAFITQVQELPNTASWASDNIRKGSALQKPKGWVMKNANKHAATSRTTLKNSALNAWSGFLDLLKVRRVSSAFS